MNKFTEIRKFMGFETKTEQNESCFPSLSYKERMIGFGICFGMGTLTSFLSIGSLFGLLLGKTNKFAILFSFGNIFSVFGTFFLMGPMNQIKLMNDPKRRYASITFISSLLLTLISYYILHLKLLTLIFVIVQIFAYYYYVLSYFPYGKDLFKKCTSCIFGSIFSGSSQGNSVISIAPAGK